ncbi:hypothetical protein VTK73DRAFT_1998 [Phialemonium thermophilum]|uniref:Uncharacterized protein n=1 Tax=Phialemonium thermophilum TaxID=223376 RepID=A0ABR3VSQ0_9PEZI
MLSSLLFCLLRWRKSRRYASDASSSSSSADRAGAPAGARPWTILTRSLWGGRPQTTQSKIIDRMIQAAYDAESGEAHPPPTDEKTAGGFAPPFDPSAGNMQQHVVARRAPGSGGGAGLPDKPFLSRPAASSLSWPFGRRSVASTEPESVASTARLVLDLEGNSPTPPLAASNASLNSPGVSSKVRSWFRRGEESRRAELEERRQRHVEATHARLVGGGRDPRGLDRTLHSQVPRPPAAMSMAAATETTEQTETTESTWTTWGFGGGGQGSRPPKETKEKKWLHWLP